MFINCSNHNSAQWGEKQLNAARVFGEIIDLPFPNVSPNATKQEIVLQATQLVNQIMQLNPNAVMCQGEFTLTFSLVKMLQDRGIIVLSACSERQSVDRYNEDGTTTKLVTFEFVQFREYA